MMPRATFWTMVLTLDSIGKPPFFAHWATIASKALKIGRCGGTLPDCFNHEKYHNINVLG